jgi:DNA-binding transcriptional LysR family regulator
MELFSMLAEAAVHGMGVALTPPWFVREELAQGRLESLCGAPVGGDRAYSLIYPEDKADQPALQAFAGWLQAQAAAPEPVAAAIP